MLSIHDQHTPQCATVEFKEKSHLTVAKSFKKNKLVCVIETFLNGREQVFYSAERLL